MAERIVTVNGRQIRAGTAEDAGRLCTSATSPEGVTGETYRGYARDGRAPGPILIPDSSAPGGLSPLASGRGRGGHLYDLDEVEQWNRGRPGTGRHRPTDPDKLGPTPLRAALLAAAAGGELLLDEGGRVAVDPLDLPVPPEQRTRQYPGRVRQQVTELQRVGVLAAPDDSGHIALTAVGRRVRERWAASGPPTRSR